jgi:inner membrane protein
MPLPIAHSMMGYAIAEVAEAANVRLTGKKWLNVSIFVALANLPDCDFLPGFLLGEPNRYHQWFTHSIGFSILAGLFGGLFYWRRNQVRPPIAENQERFGLHGIFISLAVLSHLVLDLLTWDSSPPKGMMLFWPFDTKHYDVRWSLFLSSQRDNVSATFFSSLLNWHNFKIALREFLIMAPLVGLAKIFEWLSKAREQSRSVDIKNTQVAKLGLLEVSPLPAELAKRRSMTALAEAAEQDEPDK